MKIKLYIKSAKKVMLSKHCKWYALTYIKTKNPDLEFSVKQQLW